MDKSESLTLPLIYSIAIHAVIAGVLLISFEFTPSTPEAMEVNLNQSDIEPAEEIVSAVSVDKAKVQEQVDRMKRQKAEAEGRAAEREAQLKKEMEEERARRQAARRQQVLSEVEKYQALIRQTIQRNWTVDDSMQGKSCELTISVAPSGFVKSVDTGNGDASVCRSARNAVLKANTLPVSEDPEIYQQMSTIKLTVKPQL